MKTRGSLRNGSLVAGSLVRLAALVAFAGLSTGVLAAPPSDELVKERADKFATETRVLKAENREAMEQLRLTKVAEAMDGFTLDEMTASQIATFDRARVFSFVGPEVKEQVANRLAALSAEPTIDGAEAAVLAIKYTPIYVAGRENSDITLKAQRDAFERMLNHPAIGQALSEGKAGDFYVSFSRGGPEVFEGLNIAKRIAKLVPATGTPDGALRATALGRELHDMNDSAEDKAAAWNALKTMVASGRQAVPADANARLVDSCDKAVAFFGVVGEPMPKMQITWSSDPSISSADAFKGKVVVFDFWATWCGPCRAAFPNVAKLTNYYKGYPVQIVGVTSLQGSHTDPKAENAVEQKITGLQDDPQREMNLMPSFMKNWDMNWPVVFSDKSCFNPDYGVTGIPHVAIVDPEGIVRYNGMSPHGDITHKTQIINELLQKAGLPTPPPYVEPAAEPAKTTDNRPATVPAAEIKEMPAKAGS